MHGFDNGTATRVKKDNWGQLTRFFKKASLGHGKLLGRMDPPLYHLKNDAKGRLTSLGGGRSSLPLGLCSICIVYTERDPFVQSVVLE